MKGVYTVVIVTHDIEEARRVSDDVAYLRAGQIVEFGATQAMFDAPRLAATREYLGGRFTAPAHGVMVAALD
jgi:phosphate transport system ATP-binding protein